MPEPMYLARCAGCGAIWQQTTPPPDRDVWCGPLCSELSFPPAPGDPVDHPTGYCWPERMPTRDDLERGAA